MQIEWIDDKFEACYTTPRFALVEKVCLWTGPQEEGVTPSAHVLRDDYNGCEYIAIVKAQEGRIYRHNERYWGANAWMNRTYRITYSADIFTLRYIQAKHSDLFALYQKWLQEGKSETEQDMDDAAETTSQLRARLSRLQDEISALTRKIEKARAALS